MWCSRERRCCSSGRKNMWIAGASNGINGEARSSRWSNNGDWQKPGMKIVWRLTGDERPPKKWMPSGTNSALLLHFGLFLDQRWYPCSMADRCHRLPHTVGTDRQRPSPGWIEFHQHHDLHTWQSLRLRSLEYAGEPGVELRRGPALLQESRTPGTGRFCLKTAA